MLRAEPEVFTDVSSISIGCHIEVLDDAVEAMDLGFAASHRAGDDPGLAMTPLRVCADSAGCANFLWECHDRDIGFDRNLVSV